MSTILIPVSIVFFGVGLYTFGYIRWKGKMHGSYFAYGFGREANYLSIPGGIAFILLGVAIHPSIPPLFQTILIYTAFFVVIISFFVAWHFFKPTWVKWIENNHQEVIPYLQLEIRDEGWQVTNQQELEGWITEIRYKYDL